MFYSFSLSFYELILKINTDATSFGNGSLVPIDGVADSVSKKNHINLPFFVKKKG